MQSLAGMMGAGKVPAQRLGFFFRDFSNMLGAGLSLEKVLMIFRDSAQDGRIVAACAGMAESLSVGSSLAQAMEEAKIFPALAVRVTGAGERAGNMPVVMGLLADHFQLSAGLREKCSAALFYPAGILVLLMAALVYAAERVVPQLAPLLPPDAMNSILTRSMLALAEGVRAGWLAALAGVVAIIATLVAAKRSDGIVSRLPLIGALRRDLEIALCFFDLFVRLKSGIPLDTALAEAAVDASNNTGARLEDCRRSLAAGHTFSGALAATCYFPRAVVETVRLGEEMGSYDGYCERIFKLYYQSFERRAQLLASVFQPAALALCAIFVAAMAFAFLQPVYGNLTRIGTLNP